MRWKALVSGNPLDTLDVYFQPLENFLEALEVRKCSENGQILFQNLPIFRTFSDLFRPTPKFDAVPAARAAFLKLRNSEIRKIQKPRGPKHF